MKNLLRFILPFLAVILFIPSTRAACAAQFEWAQMDGTLTVEFFNTSTSDHEIISFQWNFGDGFEGDGPHPMHEYSEPGVYLVCLVIENSEGCVSDVCHEVVVEAVSADCHAAFVWEQLPGTLNIHFINQSTSDHDIVSYLWNFGDGHTGDGQNPYHEYDEPGTYLVCLHIEDNTGCVSEICHEVVVEAISSDCNASFEWEQIPGTLNVEFFNTSTSDHEIISFQWNFGDGSEGDGPHPIHEYNEPGVYLVCLIIENSAGCVSDVCYEVVVEAVSADCHAAFEWEQIPGTLNIHFINQSTSDHDIISYLWHFGDGHTGDGQNPTHEYDEPGTYLVCLRIEDNTGCVSEVCHEVTVHAVESGCHASFEWEQIPGTLNIHFINHSTSDHDIISYLWHFGDGHTGDGQNPTHEYDEPGTYFVCLRIEDNTGCVSEVCHEVTVHSPEDCEAAFNFETDDDGVVHFNNISSGATPHTSWFWEFGDGETSTEENPTHEYDEPGIYTICLTMSDSTNDCFDEFCLTLVYQLGWEDSHYEAGRERTYNPHYLTGSLDEEIEIVRYTNPVSEELSIDYYLRSKEVVDIQLYDLTGYQLFSKHAAPAGDGLQHDVLYVGDIQPGIYILAIGSGNQHKCIRISIAR